MAFNTYFTGRIKPFASIIMDGATPTTITSYNASGIRSATGVFNITLTPIAPDENYYVTVGVNGGSNKSRYHEPQILNKTSSGFTVEFYGDYSSNYNLINPDQFWVEVSL